MKWQRCSTFTSVRRQIQTDVALETRQIVGLDYTTELTDPSAEGNTVELACTGMRNLAFPFQYIQDSSITSDG